MKIVIAPDKFKGSLPAAEVAGAIADGGAGLLRALGAQVLDARGEPLARGGAALRDVATLKLTGLHPALRDVATLKPAGPHPALRVSSVILATDVVNPLTGP